MRSPGAAERHLHPFSVSNTGAFSDSMYGGILLPAKTDIVMRVTAITTNAGTITSAMDILEYTA